MPRSYNWSAPAKLFFWPADDGSDEEVVYPTLRDALRAAAEGEGEAKNAWIITEDGDILNPKMVEEARLDAPPRRASARSGLFGWARAA